MIQFILVAALAIGAAFFLGRKIFNLVRGTDQPGCEKCAANEVARKRA
ncbi:hypothetical protein [Marinoscillum furvescens]|uniref:Uncharacterized protein n=1 Tax=Marinoscillum furvescens DSM 4134 TaxID=1122208 RepID=A0A3D9L635_MARFU|nr:hypothetical protein [Marinoscillum furvescens]REE00438.1 hypothetical protein C7460_10559 [Marinoscillum furvescens DSM 4134]